MSLHSCSPSQALAKHPAANPHGALYCFSLYKHWLPGFESSAPASCLLPTFTRVSSGCSGELLKHLLFPLRPGTDPVLALAASLAYGRRVAG